MDVLLVDGYIRQIEKLLDTNMIMPLEIFHICFDFYFVTKFLFYITSNNKKKVIQKNDSLVCIAQLDSKQNWNAKIYDLDKHKTEMTMKDSYSNKWNISGAGVTFAKNVKLPASIVDTIGSTHSNYILYRCGGSDGAINSINYVAALIINSHQFQQNNTEFITAYNWLLPKFPTAINYNSIIYSHAYNALFSIGGMNNFNTETNSIYKLSFDINDIIYNEQNLQAWKWQKLKIKLKESRQSACFTMINNSKDLIAVSGYAVGTYRKSVELIDLNNMNKASQLLCDINIARLDGGIYFDETNELIYVGGGFNDRVDAKAFNSVECFNLEKNVWNVLPDTRLKHDMDPLLWIEDSNLLHIMSVMSNGVECIDLRELKKWKIKTQNLDQVFNVVFDIDNDISKCRIIGN